MAPNITVDAVRYLSPSRCARYIEASLLRTRSAEPIGEPVAVHRRHPLEICDRGLGLVSLNMKIGHRPRAESEWIHQEPGEPVGTLWPRVSRPHRIHPSARQIGRVVRAVAEEGMTVDAGTALDHKFSFGDQR